MKKFLRIFSFAAIFALLFHAAVFAASVDWNDGSITAEGIGVFPALDNPGQARAMARRAAIVDAYRNLGEYVESVRVTSETTVRNSMVENDIVKTKMSAIIKEAVIVAEEPDGRGNYLVVLKMPIYGKGSLASAVLQQPATVKPFPPPTVSEPSPPPAIGKPAKGSYGRGYTGLVIDCRGLDLSPVMSPVIYDENRRPIYGYDNLDYQKVIDIGMADYEKGDGNFRRSGDNPLIVKAIALDGHGGNPVISEADANYILAENTKTHFLDNLAVVFIS
ncbi:MAG: hypothetical protein LBP78_06455 [Acidaminococcales bacterium]|jgi:hypothetical protein|nr:hypothetical protein [Acidaminococcales bacterium]